MARTQFIKIRRDVLSRKGRTALVVLSILIGVFGVSTMISLTDLINTQLEEDLQPEAIAHSHVYVNAPGDAMEPGENEAALAHIAALDGVVDAEGQAVYSVAWRKAGDTEGRFDDATVIASTEPFGTANLEPIVRITQGRYPQAGEIAVEQRFADATGVKLGDQLVFRHDPMRTWEVVGFVIHPYVTMASVLQDQVPQEQAIYASYNDVAAIAGATGLTGFQVRYQDMATAEGGLGTLMQTISAQTSYVPNSTFLDDPDDNFVLSIVSQVTAMLDVLGVVAMVVSGFLVTNVMNTIIVEQKRQIGTMKSLGATTWDNFAIYAGIALVYGVIGTLGGVLLALPTAALAAQAIGAMAFAYIDGFRVSLLGIGVGVVMGLAVPVLAALIPVLNGMRISILEAMTDLGIASNWGQTRLSRFIGGLPLPRVMVQGLSNIYQKRGRLLLTGLTLTLAVAAFMGVTAVDGALSGFVADLSDPFRYEIMIIPQEGQPFDEIAAIITENVPDATAVYAGFSMAVGVEGYESTDPLNVGSDQVTVTGIDPARPAMAFDLSAGDGWQSDPSRAGIVVSRSVAENLGKRVGDDVALTVGETAQRYTIIGVADYAFDAIYMDWHTLASQAGYVDDAGDPLVGLVYVDLAGSPSIATVDDQIDVVADVLDTHGVRASYLNQPELTEMQAEQVGAFGMIFNVTSALMALVGAIGLMAVLSMAVFERQKEIGVMRSVGATSSAIIIQFLLEGVLVGALAWIAAAPLSVALGMGLMAVLPFDYLTFSYPPVVLVMGLGGVLVIAALASLWPSLMASRKTVAEILRYQ